MSKRFVFIILLAMFVSMSMLAYNLQPVKSEAETIYVDDDNILGPWSGNYTNPCRNITHGIALAKVGNKVFVRNGTYRESVVVNKDNLTLEGESKIATIIRAPIVGSGTGIYLQNTDNATITNFTITSFMYGIFLYSSQKNRISSNTICNNTEDGIGFYPYADYNNFTANRISNNTYGFRFYAVATGNRFYHNNVIGNLVQAYNLTRQYNIWDNGKEGNFWSNYNGTDNNGDDIGDSPHIIAKGIVDAYPLMNPYPLTGLPWPMFRRNSQNVGYSQSFAPHTNTTLWRYPTDSAVKYPPAVAYGMIFISSFRNQTYALNATTGVLMWKNVTKAGFDFSPAVAYGMVFLISNRTVYALDAVTGRQVWTYPASSLLDSHLIVKYGRVYVASLMRLYCINAMTGELDWDWPCSIGGLGSSSPTIDGDVIYICSNVPSLVYAINATSGKYMWNTTIQGFVLSSPGIADNKIYIGTTNNIIYCLNALNKGKQMWNYTTNDEIHSSPAIGYGCVYFGSNDKKVYCLNASATSMTADKRRIWSYETGGRVDSDPALAHGMVFVSSWDSNAYALNASTGDLIWNYKTDGEIYSSAAIAYDTVFFGSNNNKTYAFGAPDIAVANVKSIKTVVCQNYTTRLNVTVANHFFSMETFNLTLYGNSTVIAEESIILKKENSTTINFTWDTTGWLKGNYTIWAYASPVPNETYTSDNTFTCWIIVSMVGDITSEATGYPDGRCDMSDIYVVCKRFGKFYPNPEYVPNYDIDNDGRIDMNDIYIVCKNFGKIDP